MDDLFTLHPHGVFLRREVLEAGYSDRDLLMGIRDGFLVRIRHGAYVRADTWSGCDDLGQHVLRCQAVHLNHAPYVAISHMSGAAVSGLRLWNADLSKVHVTRLDGLPGKQSADVVYHRAVERPVQIGRIAEMHVLPPAWCAAGTAALSSVEAGLVTVDSAYHLGLATEEDMRAATAAMSGWPGTARLQMTMRLAEPGSESVGESRIRYLFFKEHLPRPVLQYEIRDQAGEVVGTSDFAWPEHGVLGEFDGRIKYGRLLRPGQSISDAVYAEKVREDAMRELTGWSMIRFTWADLDRPGATAARLRRMLGRYRGAA
jgi:hypothetical protein